MSDGARRDVTINIKVVGDSANSGVTSKLEKEVIGVHEKIERAATRGAERAAKEAEKAAARETKAAEKAATDKEKSDNRVFQNRIKMLARLEAAESKQAKDAERANKQAERDQDRVTRTRLQMVAKLQAAEAKRVTDEEKGRERAEKSLTRLEGKLIKQQALQERMALGMMRASGHMVHAITEIAEGLALVGITSEEDTAKFIRMFSAVHGIAGAVKGVVGVMTSLVHTTTLYEKGLHAAVVEEETLLALEQARGVAGGAGAASGALKGATHSGVGGRLAEGAVEIGLNAVTAGAAANPKGAKGLIGRAGGAIKSGAQWLLPTLLGGAASAKAGGSLFSRIPGMLGRSAGMVGRGAAGAIGGMGVPGVAGGTGGMASLAGSGLLGGLAAFEGIQGAKRLFSGQNLVSGGAPQGEHKGYLGNLGGIFTGSNNESFLHSIGSWWNARGSSNESEEATKHATEERDAKIKRASERDEHAMKHGESHKKLIEAERAVAEAKGSREEDSLTKGGDALDSFNNRELENARHEVAEAKKQAEELKKQGELGNHGAILAALDRERDASSEILKTEKEKVRTLEQQQEKQTEIIKHNEHELKQAREKVKEEQKKYNTRGADLALAGAAMRRAVTDIGMKLSKGGKLTDIDARILHKGGFGKELVNKHMTSKLNDNEKTALHALGEDNELNEAKNKATEIETKLNEARENEEKVLNRVAEAKEKEIKAAERIADVVSRIVEQTGIKEGIKISGKELQHEQRTEKKAKKAEKAEKGHHGHKNGDLVTAVEGAGLDISNSVDGAIDALNTMTTSAIENHRRLEQAVRRSANQMSLSQVS